MKVEKGKTLLAKGKVKIEGEAEVLGASVSSFESNKYVPVYCISDCDIDVNGDYTIIEGCTIPESWKKLAKKDWECLFIYGGVDRGKSTLATYLANKCGGCYVLDLDIGQSDIAHPAAMGYGYARNIVSLSDVEMINGYFVGYISPMGREAKCLRGVARLWRELKKLEGRKIIDTTGWIRGKKAKEYKLAKIEIIQPDIIASFEGKLAFLDDYEVFEVESGTVIERDRIERARIRSEIYAKWMSGAESVEVDISKVRVISGIFDGKEIPRDFIQEVLGCEILFVRKGSDFLNLCLAKKASLDLSLLKGLKELYGVEDLYVFSSDDLHNLVVGLYKGKQYLGIGLLKKIEDGKLVVETKAKDFDRIEFGEFRLDGGKEYIVRIP